MPDIERILETLVKDTTGDDTIFPELEYDSIRLRGLVENSVNLDEITKNYFAMMLKIISDSYINKLDICYTVQYVPEPIKFGKYASIYLKTLSKYIDIINNSSLKHGYKINAVCQGFEDKDIIVIPDKCKSLWISIIVSVCHSAMLYGSPTESDNDDTVVVILNKNEDYLEISNAVFVDDNAYDNQLNRLNEEAIKWFFSKFSYPDVEFKYVDDVYPPKRMVRIPLRNKRTV